MKLLTLFSVFALATVVTAFLFITTMTNDVDPKEEIFAMPKEKSFDETLTKTHTAFTALHPYPKDFEKTRKLLASKLGAKNIKNGLLIQPSIYIKKYGRLGNNILQLSNTIYLAEVMNVSTIYIEKNYCYIKEPFITSKGIRIIPTDKKLNESYVLGEFGYNMYVEDYCPENRVYEFAGETLKNLPQVKTEDDSLYIHIRSGDAFVRHCPYLGQPPACFYEGIIEKWGFKNVYILCENTKNPVIPYLVKRYDAKLLIIDLKETVSIILDAKNLVVSFGTFIPSVLKLTPEDPKKRIFRYGDKFYFARIFWKKFYFTDVSDNYYNALLNINWKNTPEQREMMFNETCGDEWKISMYTEYSQT